MKRSNTGRHTPGPDYGIYRVKIPGPKKIHAEILFLRKIFERVVIIVVNKKFRINPYIPGA